MAKSKWPQVKERFHDIETWLKKGLSEYQIYTNLGISKTTWESYKKKYSELIDLLKKGKECQVSEVENSLFKLATGFYYYVDEAIKVKEPGGGERIEVVRLQKFKPPETGAAAFFLKNKAREDYADNPQMVDLKKQELEIRRKESEFKAW